MKELVAGFAALGLMGCAMTMETQAPPEFPAVATPMAWTDVAGMAAPAAGQRFAYGDAPEQFAILRQPDGEGPFPVVILLHGGCWLADYDHGYFEHWAQWFADRGWASVNLEYRRVGSPGGGWPGTFDDVVAGISAVFNQPQAQRLDPERMALMGHSAGGHLALWASALESLPVQPRLVIGLAAITDLVAYSEGPEASCHGAVPKLMGGRPETLADRYVSVSPAHMQPPAASVVLIHGLADPIVDPSEAEVYVRRVAEQGGSARWVPLVGAGHFDLAVPTPVSAMAVDYAIDRLSR